MSATMTQRDTVFRSPVQWDAATKRATGSSRRISGLAAVFNQRTELYRGVYEQIAPGAFTRALADTVNLKRVVLNFGHDSNLLLASVRSGSLRLSQTSEGLRFEADLVKTTTADDVLSLIRSGDLAECSFAFTISDENEERVPGGNLITIREVGTLYDVCVAAQAAYPQTMVEARSARAIERITGVRPRQSVDAYSGSEAGKAHFFLDLLVAQSEGQQRTDYSGPRTIRDDIDVEHARNRIATCQSRAGDSSALTSGGEFAGGSALPADIANAFAIGARTTAVVAPLFESNPLTSAELSGSQPGSTHMTIKIPRIGTGSSVSVMTADGATVSNTDPVTNELIVPVATISGGQLLSYQIYDLSSPSIETVIARELGSLIGAEADNQLLNGSGASGQTQGINGVSGVTSVAYVDASPTQAEFLPFVAQAWTQTMTARGIAPNVAIVHGRRWAWLTAGQDATTLRPIYLGELADGDDITLEGGAPVGSIAPGLRTYCSPKVTTTAGGGTEDRVYLLRKEDLKLYESGIKLLVSEQPASGPAAAQMRITAYRYLASVPHIYPTSIGVVSGTGLAAVSGYS